MSGLSYIKKLSWACLCIAGVACTKSSTGPNGNNNAGKPGNLSVQARKYAVQFNIGDVDAPDTRVAAKEMPIRNYLWYLYYAAYDSNGYQVSKIIQDSLNRDYMGPEFGVVKDSLAPGNYTVVVVGERYNQIKIKNDSLLSTLNLAGNQDYQDYVFLKKYPIHVGNADTTIKAIKLEPITGQLEVLMTDSNRTEMPEGTISIDSVPSKYVALTAATSLFGTNSFTSYFNLYSSWTVDYGILGSNASHTVTITLHDSNGNTTLERTIKDVYVYPGRKTILRGKLFGSQGGRSARLPDRTINSANGDIIQDF